MYKNKTIVGNLIYIERKKSNCFTLFYILVILTLT